MNQEQRTVNLQEDEIDLRELFKTIYKYKNIVFIMTLGITAIAVIYAYMQKPIYEVKSNIQVGYIGENLLDTPKSIEKTLSVVFNVENKQKNGKFISDITSVSINKNVPNFIEIKSEGISNDEALKKNKEVLEYLKNMHKKKIEQYIFSTKNKIEDTKGEIQKIEDYETKNIKQKIEQIISQQIAKIDEKIDKLQTQDIAKLQKQIDILKNQEIKKIDEKISLLLNTDMPAIETKITHYTQKLAEYNKETQKLNKTAQNSSNETSVMISSVQMVNYQNMILNALNMIEDLKIEKEHIIKETIPGLNRTKENIENIKIRDLMLQIENIKNIAITDLNREKENLNNENIRKLRYRLDVELPEKRSKLMDEIELLKLSLTENYVKNHELVGDFYISEHPVKPKKRLIVVAAFVSALILSIFFIFALEFFKSSQRDEK